MIRYLIITLYTYAPVVLKQSLRFSNYYRIKALLMPSLVCSLGPAREDIVMVGFIRENYVA
jgi:hypothetical protein